ncbi:sulfotransferase family protein [Puniceibacterium sp. IMCC21224]|uniref:sulfotransferase-like domain-containing protein n=1 Tax=Puniceibacterium sp. IMCC21224 TaxID=1618204 RepID=UPI00064DC176|nr:sulfotransferase family protein [Puniceibacterium sp. IMCC21224]KMK65425.1 hypothetical protein IMCC21224_11256 [Puniceibacterium sp. IMCC21224]
MRIAMWSGPRNLSTAMMYAFGNRADFHVVDEPFYGPYLRRSGLNHPMREEILTSRPESAKQVAEALRGPVPGAKPHSYQKHMTQHMLPGIARDWMAQVVNVFLIRHPARVVASFGAKYQAVTLDDIGFVQQAALYDEIRAMGQDPVIIDSADIRRAPEEMLRKLCAAINLPFDPAMLSWPAGGHAADGVWAPIWYGAVHRSTSFAEVEGPLPLLSGAAAEIVDAALVPYERLASRRLK